MCRILLVKSHLPILPKEILSAFAQISKESKALDGDWQGDGWGISYLKEKNEWVSFHSLQPIWENESIFDTLPPTSIFTAHARSASFAHHKNIIEYNQPYSDGHTAFVFNGLIKKVSMPYSLEGKIGAQKIWSLVQRELKNKAPQDALHHTRDVITSHSERIQAMNIGLATPEGIFALSAFTQSPEYYALRYWQDSNLSIICSEQLPSYKDFQTMQNNEIISL